MPKGAWMRVAPPDVIGAAVLVGRIATSEWLRTLRTTRPRTTTAGAVRRAARPALTRLRRSGGRNRKEGGC